MTSPEAYSSEVKAWPEANGNKAVAIVAHFMIANKTAN